MVVVLLENVNNNLRLFFVQDGWFGWFGWFVGWLVGFCWLVFVGWLVGWLVWVLLG